MCEEAGINNHKLCQHFNKANTREGTWNCCFLGVAYVQFVKYIKKEVSWKPLILIRINACQKNA